jgi:hypothetical protein
MFFGVVFAAQKLPVAGPVRPALTPRNYVIQIERRGIPFDSTHLAMGIEFQEHVFDSTPFGF